MEIGKTKIAGNSFIRSVDYKYFISAALVLFNIYIIICVHMRRFPYINYLKYINAANTK